MAAVRKTSELSYVFQGLSDHTLDDIGNLCPLDNGHHSPSIYALGALEQLPPELLHMVLAQLDIRSLTDFRRLNKRAMDAVNFIPQYKQIIKYAPVSVRGILSIGTGAWITCQDLYKNLSTAECDSCGDYGEYLYLVTCRRVCFLCFTEKTDYLPLVRTDAVRKFGPQHGHLAILPSMKSIPGYYSSRKIRCRAQFTLIDYKTARQAGIDLHGTVKAMEQCVLEATSKKIEKYQSRTSHHATGHAGPTPRPPRLEDEFDGCTSNPKRFMAVIRAPFLDRRMGIPEWGFHCVACKAHHYARPLHWRRTFTKDSFGDHIRECGEIIDGKHIEKMV